MSEESTMPDPVELTRRAFKVASDHDTDALMGFYAPDAVLDLSDVGIGTFEGVAAIRGFLEDWWGTWANHLVEVEEFVDLGHGVTFSPVREDGRLVGSDRHVEHRRAIVLVWAQDSVERHIAYHEIDEGRAAAERLAEERG
jgi:ketosteroid isomerase-like protein